MKTSIIISGQISGNSTLKSSISTVFSSEKQLRYSGFVISFPTKKQAVKALSAAFQSLKSNEPDYHRNGGISYSRGIFLAYDASTAKLISNR